jgi:hypothetical protein
MTAEPIVELAVIVALMLFVYRGGMESARTLLWSGWRGIAMEDSIWLALFAALVVLLGLAVVFSRE